MDLQGLNDQQKQAVLSEAPSLLVLAGAGSGKTRVLTQRIAYLIQEKGVAPWQVLAFTFTNKAAGEMKDRVARALGRPVDSLWIGTFHSICSRLLRREIVHLGYASNFTIYDAGDQASLVKQILKQGHMEDQGMSPRAILSAISLLKNRGIPVEEALDRAENPVDLLVARVYRAYEGAKKKTMPWTSTT
nr:UvrD-helicase domain-containing protein [Kallipyga massiliensis]